MAFDMDIVLTLVVLWVAAAAAFTAGLAHSGAHDGFTAERELEIPA